MFIIIIKLLVRNEKLIDENVFTVCESLFHNFFNFCTYFKMLTSVATQLPMVAIAMPIVPMKSGDTSVPVLLTSV